jgi:hypothetical protein
MKYATAEAFRVALEQRLLARSRDRNVQLIRLRKQVVFDRLIARLLASAPDRWVVKGGIALELRYGVRARMTKDLDLGRRGSEEAATAELEDALAVNLGDFFRFGIRTATDIDDMTERVAIRYRIGSTLAGRRFEDVVVDVAISGSLVGEPESLGGLDLLDFAGIAPAVIPVVGLEQHVSEKLHAYTRTYEGQRPSSRVKDLIDLVLIRASSTFEAGDLRRALRLTFSDRSSQNLPAQLPPPPSGWAATYPALADEVGLDPDVAIGHRLAAEFLDPILSGAVADDARWDPTSGAWREPP